MALHHMTTFQVVRGKQEAMQIVRLIDIRDSEAEIEYTCPIGLGGNRKNEVLSMAQIGSRGRARTGPLPSSLLRNSLIDTRNPVIPTLTRRFALRKTIFQNHPTRDPVSFHNF